MGKQLSPPVNIPPGIVVDVTIPVRNNTKELIVPGAGCPKGISGKPCVPPGVRWEGRKKTRFRHIRLIRHLNEALLVFELIVRNG